MASASQQRLPTAPRRSGGAFGGGVERQLLGAVEQVAWLTQGYPKSPLEKLAHSFSRRRRDRMFPVLASEVEIPRTPMEIAQYGIPEIGPGEPSGRLEAVPAIPCRRSFALLPIPQRSILLLQ
jgi:hypothetical protein